MCRKVDVMCSYSVAVDRGFIPVCLLFLQGGIVNDEKFLMT